MTVNGSAPSKQLMQKTNRLRVLDEIRRAEGITRSALSRRTGLSLASITNIVAYLKAKHIVDETETEEDGRVGRKAALLEYNYTAYDVVCVRIGTEEMAISLTDLSGAVKHTAVKNIADAGAAFDTGRLRAEVKAFIQAHATGSTLAVGVALSGLVLNDGEYMLSAGLKWEVSCLKQQLEEDVRLPVVIFNVTISSALNACFATGSSALESVVFVDLDGGVGAVQICRGRVNCMAVGEIGHTTIEKDGELCFCGNRGCLELMCSPERILASARAAAGDGSLSLAGAFALLEKNEAVRAAVDGCLEYLGIAVANVINIFLPEKVIINYASLFRFGYVHEYVTGCVKRRVHYALQGKVKVEQAFVDAAGKRKGIAQYLVDTIFDVSFSGGIIE